MYVAIEDKIQIKEAQGILLKRLQGMLPLLPEKFVVGYQGGSFEIDDLRSNGVIWYAHQIGSNATIPRYWNAFGVASELRSKGSNKIIAEANVALEGNTKMVAGRFVQDDRSGKIALIHSGKIGGGRKGVGKSAFLNWYQGEKVEFVYSDNAKSRVDGILVAELDSDRLGQQLCDFVKAVYEFKHGDAELEINQLSNSKLREKAIHSGGKPKVTVGTVGISYSRSPYVSAYAKRRANGKCDLCLENAPFSSGGNPYLECHHIVWLSNGGDDSIDNTVALCPNCHRKMHSLNVKDDVNKLLKRASKAI